MKQEWDLMALTPLLVREKQANVWEFKVPGSSEFQPELVSDILSQIKKNAASNFDLKGLNSITDMLDIFVGL